MFAPKWLALCTQCYISNPATEDAVGTRIKCKRCAIDFTVESEKHFLLLESATNQSGKPAGDQYCMCHNCRIGVIISPQGGATCPQCNTQLIPEGGHGVPQSEIDAMVTAVANLTIPADQSPQEQSSSRPNTTNLGTATPAPSTRSSPLACTDCGNTNLKVSRDPFEIDYSCRNRKCSLFNCVVVRQCTTCGAVDSSERRDIGGHRVRVCTACNANRTLLVKKPLSTYLLFHLLLPNTGASEFYIGNWLAGIMTAIGFNIIPIAIAVEPQLASVLSFGLVGAAVWWLWQLATSVVGWNESLQNYRNR